MRIYSNNQIGDTLMQTPAVRAWKKANPGKALIYLCGPKVDSILLLQHNPYIDELISVRESIAEADCVLRAEDAYWRGFRAGKTMAWAFGNLLGIEIDGLKYDYRIRPEECVWARQKLNEIGGKVILVARHSTSCTSNNPKIGTPNKCIANRLWVELATWLMENGYTPVAIGSREEAADIRYEIWPGPMLYGENLRNIASLCRQAYAVLTLDNGIRHIAAGSGADTLCVSGAIPPWLIHCEAVREGQVIEEHFRSVRLMTAESLIRWTSKLLKKKSSGAPN